jgi:hypothetical protein
MRARRRWVVTVLKEMAKAFRLRPGAQQLRLARCLINRSCSPAGEVEQFLLYEFIVAMLWSVTADCETLLVC